MKTFLAAACASLLLAGCASIEYHEFVGEPTLQQGAGGARDVVDGVEIWHKGAPNRPFIVIGYIDGEFADEWLAEDSLRAQIAQQVKAVGGSGVIRTARRKAPGDAYFVGNVLVQDDEVRDEYLVFKYGESSRRASP